MALSEVQSDVTIPQQVIETPLISQRVEVDSVTLEYEEYAIYVMTHVEVSEIL